MGVTAKYIKIAKQITAYYLLLRPRERLQSIVMSVSVCLWVCLSVCGCVCLSVSVSVCLWVCLSVSGSTSAISFLHTLRMSVARSSSGMLTIGHIAYRREGGDGGAQHGRSVIYNCVVKMLIKHSNLMSLWGVTGVYGTGKV